jgi:GAF domain-containing protein
MSRPIATIKRTFLLQRGRAQGRRWRARVIREQVAVVTNDVLKDTALVFGAMHAGAGIRSIAGLPLIVSDKTIGVFVLYTSKPEFFDAAGMLLLTELAGNVAFAIDHIEKQERLDRFAYYDALTGTCEPQPVHRPAHPAYAQRCQRRPQAGRVPDRPGALQEIQRQPRAVPPATRC